MNKKIFAITLLSGFVLFNLPLSVLGADSILTYQCSQGIPTNIQSTNVIYCKISEPSIIPGGSEKTCNNLTAFKRADGTIDGCGTQEQQKTVECFASCATGQEKIACPTDTKKFQCITKTPVTSKQNISGYIMKVKIPCQPIAGGTCPTNYGANPANYIARIYQFGLMIAGLAAFGMIVFGALQYVLSAGNMGSQEDAKDRITQAVFGLVLLFGAYLILYTINPNLVNLTNPNMPALDLSSITGVEDGGIGGGLGGVKEEHPLCQTGTYTGISVTSGINIGGQTPSLPSFVCEKCKTNAHKSDTMECVCDAGYVQINNQCLLAPTDTGPIVCGVGTIYSEGKCIKSASGLNTNPPNIAPAQ